MHTRLAQRSVWLTACAIPLLALLVWAALNHRHLQDRASALERENLQLQLQQLAREVAGQSDQLAERARDLAQSEQIAQLLQDDAAAPLDRSALLSLARRGVDALLVVSASQAVRFSATIAGDRMVDEPPAPGMINFLASVTAGVGAPDVPGFADNHWVVARAVTSKNSPASILGWVVTARSIARVEHQATSAGNTLIARPLREFDASVLPAELFKPAASASAKNFEIDTYPSRDKSPGYVALRDG
jgi:hypothetical protein